MKIAVIGAGSMGMAFIRCWLAKEVQTKESITVIETSSARIEELRIEAQVNISGSYETAKDAQILFIAVKPQDFKQAASQILKVMNSDQIVVSIMAGVKCETIRSLLNGHTRIVRAMPNLPILINEGISAYYADPTVDQVMLNILDQLFRAGGEVMRLENENLLNAVTALSGSGPGYVFYMLENLMQVSKELGFDEMQAKNLLSSTFKGSAELWRKDKRSAEELRKAVTSKGGTTEAAISHYEEKKLGKILKEGVAKAAARAEKIANGN